MRCHELFSRWAASMQLPEKRVKAQTTNDPSKLNISVPISAGKPLGDHGFKQPRESDSHLPNVHSTEEECDPLLQICGEPVCQIMSDFHLEWREYEKFEIARQAPNLLLVGDIGRFYDYDRFLGFLRLQCEIFDRVLLVPGNHEFYGSSRQEGLEIAAEFERKLGEKFVLMHRQRVDLNNGEVVILGCTLHSSIPENYTALTNNFARIQCWRVQHHNEEHAFDLEWLERSLAEVNDSTPKSRVIIANHYAPAFEKTVHPTHEYNNLRSCFSSNALNKLQDWNGANLVSHWVRYSCI